MYARIRRAASTPLMPGRLMSISTTLGLDAFRRGHRVLARLGLSRHPPAATRFTTVRAINRNGR